MKQNYIKFFIGLLCIAPAKIVAVDPKIPKGVLSKNKNSKDEVDITFDGISKPKTTQQVVIHHIQSFL